MSFDSATSLAGLWDSLLPIGRDDSTGGYRRFSWTPEDQQCRAWFTSAAAERGLRNHYARQRNLWAWWDWPDSSPGPASAADAAGGSGPSGSGVSPGGTVAPPAGTVGTGR